MLAILSQHRKIINMITFASYFAVTTPGSIQKEIVVLYGINYTEYGMLFSIYSLPNIFLSFFAGFLITKIGTSFSLLLLTSSLLIGQVIFTMSSFVPDFSIALIGRLILGYEFSCAY